MKRIVIDLDVITVYLWDNDNRADYARSFIEKVKNGAFQVLVPYTLIELAEKWSYIELRNNVLRFYESVGTEVKAGQVKQKLDELKVNDKEFAINLISIGVKEEDAALVMIASLFNADYLITFNRKHLKNKELGINKVLESFRLPKITIRQPQDMNGEENEK